MVTVNQVWQKTSDKFKEKMGKDEGVRNEEKT